GRQLDRRPFLEDDDVFAVALAREHERSRSLRFARLQEETKQIRLRERLCRAAFAHRPTLAKRRRRQKARRRGTCRSNRLPSRASQVRSKTRVSLNAPPCLLIVRPFVHEEEFAAQSACFGDCSVERSPTQLPAAPTT